MSWETVAVIADWHTFVGLSIIAFFLIRRADKVLRLFGWAMAGLAAFRLVWAAMVTIGLETFRTSDVRFFWILVIAAPAAVALFLALRVGADDEPPSRRRWVMAAGVLFILLLMAVRFIWPLPEATQLHPLSTTLLVFGLAAAFFTALHTALEHSKGPGYAILFESAFAVMMMAMTAEVVAGLLSYAYAGDAGSEATLYVSRMTDVIASVAALVLWVSVVVHERKEIAREHAAGA